MKDYAVEFSEYLIKVKKASPNTAQAYLGDLSQFLSYCALNKVKDINNIDEAFLNKYIELLTTSGKSSSTVSRITASVRCYFKFLVTSGYVLQNPLDKIKLKKAVHKVPGILDTNEIVLLLSQPDGKDLKSARDRAMLELLYATGIKVSELIGISVSDINLQLGILRLSNEHHERIIPIYPQAVKHIEYYVNNVRSIIALPETGDTLFTNMNGKPMSRQGLWKIIKHYADAAGISKDITPHTLRHSFAAHLLENGAQLKDIKEMLGHSDISSTQIYAQLLKNKYALSYQKYHPLAK